MEGQRPEWVPGQPKLFCKSKANNAEQKTNTNTKKKKKSQQQQYTQPRSWLFEKASKINKHLAKPAGEGGEKQIKKIRDKRGTVKRDSNTIQNITREYIAHLFSKNLENLEGMDGYISEHMWPTKTKTTKYKELKTMSGDVGAVTVPDGLTAESYKNFKIWHNTSQIAHKIYRERILWGWFYKVSSILIPNPHKDMIKK